jgi:environmental stress-induced protein Ves
VRWADATPRPWRNGGGVSRDLWQWPEGEDWRLRVAVADIDRDGPFSAYPGVERWFAVLEGEGVCLRFAHGVHRMGPADPALRFDGAAAPGCELLGGKTLDLNLMLRGVSGEMVRAETGVPWSPTAAQCGLFATRGGLVRVEGPDGTSARHALPAMGLLWWDRAPSGLCLEPDEGDGPPPAGWWMSAGAAKAGA